MTDQPAIALPPALSRALGLLANPPATPDISKGYLDLLETSPSADSAPPRNTGAIQSFWDSGVGAMSFDRAQAILRKVVRASRLPTEWLNIQSGEVALDVGCGPGSVTAVLGRAVGPDGLALGVDISGPMVARAVKAEAAPNVGFLRADAQQLPLRDGTVDTAVSIAVLQLIPNPATTLAEMARVLRPGGRLGVMVPTLGRTASLLRFLPAGMAHIFGDDEVGDVLEDLDLAGVRTKTVGSLQWVRARRP